MINIDTQIIQSFWSHKIVKKLSRNIFIFLLKKSYRDFDVNFVVLR